MPTQNISATIDKNLLTRLDQLANKIERNRSWLLTKAVETYLEELEDLYLAKKRLHEERVSPHLLRKMIGV